MCGHAAAAVDTIKVLAYFASDHFVEFQVPATTITNQLIGYLNGMAFELLKVAGAGRHRSRQHSAVAALAKHNWLLNSFPLKQMPPLISMFSCTMWVCLHPPILKSKALHMYTGKILPLFSIFSVAIAEAALGGIGLIECHAAGVTPCQIVVPHPALYGAPITTGLMHQLIVNALVQAVAAHPQYIPRDIRKITEDLQ